MSEPRHPASLLLPAVLWTVLAGPAMIGLALARRHALWTVNLHELSASLRQTVSLALGACALALLLGGAAAATLLRAHDRSTQRRLDQLANVLLALPSLVWIALLAALAQRTGSLVGTAALALGLAHAPRVYLALSGATAVLGQEQWQAAEALGASRWQAWRLVALARGRPAAAVALGEVWSRCVGELGVVLLLAPGVSASDSPLAVSLLRASPGGATALALSLLLAAVTGAALLRALAAVWGRGVGAT